MKKSVFSMLCVSIFAVNVFAQTSTFMKDDQFIGLGIGIFGGHNFGNNYSGTPYFTGYYEKCVKDNLFDNKSSLGIGATLGYKSNKYETTLLGETWGWKYTYFLIGARGSLHYAFVDKLDTYAGLMLGYRIASSKAFGSYASGISATSYGGFTSDFYVGGRYYFTDTFAVFLELGYSWFSNGTIGVSLKF
jgi:hypothetical protein